MICPQCKEHVKIYRSKKRPVWKAECSCAYTEAPGMETCMELHIHETKKRLSDNASAKTQDDQARPPRR